MKNFAFNFNKSLILTLFAFAGMNMYSQNSEQSRSFINRSHVAVAKVEKEMFKTGNNTQSANLKKAIKLQMIAVKLQSEGNFKQAIGYSLKSRQECLTLLTNQVTAEEKAWYELNDEEKVYCNANDFINMNYNLGLLGTKDNSKVEALDVLDIQKFHELVLNVK